MKKYCISIRVYEYSTGYQEEYEMNWTIKTEQEDKFLDGFQMGLMELEDDINEKLEIR